MHISLKFGTYSGFLFSGRVFPVQLFRVRPRADELARVHGQDYCAVFVAKKYFFFAELTFVVLFKLGGKRATGPAVIIQRC